MNLSYFSSPKDRKDQSNEPDSSIGQLTLVDMDPHVAARMRAYTSNEHVKRNVDAAKDRARQLLDEL